MSVKMMARVWARSTMKDGKLLVLLALADFANDSGECWPSIPTLATKARLTDRQTRRVLDKLEAAKEVERTRSSGGRNQRTRYKIILPENPDKITLKKLQGKNNTVIQDTQNPDICDPKTLTPASGALNRHIEPSYNRQSVKASPSRAQASDHNVKEFVLRFAEEYERRFNKPYHIGWAKEGKLVKELLTTYTLEQLREKGRLLFNSNDPWIRDNGGYTIGVLYSQINRLGARSGERPRRMLE